MSGNVLMCPAYHTYVWIPFTLFGNFVNVLGKEAQQLCQTISQMDATCATTVLIVFLTMPMTIGGMVSTATCNQALTRLAGSAIQLMLYHTPPNLESHYFKIV